MSNYDDIINLPRHVSSTRKPMSIEARASIFAPFQALNGYGDAIKETARLVDKKIELTEEEKNNIDNILHIINDKIKDKPLVSVTYFVKDKYKDGGKYINYSSNVRKIDLINKCIIFIDNFKVDIEDILQLDIV